MAAFWDFQTERVIQQDQVVTILWDSFLDSDLSRGYPDCFISRLGWDSFDNGSLFGSHTLWIYDNIPVCGLVKHKVGWWCKSLIWQNACQ